ncbi:MAG TPA: N-acetylmuramoyl-L-alanine amidase [Solirubrobacteraceae bacterium]|nr:N-acetylmuramoyl-L-alanine amidase [Solirubrobacteraceae bacterium]
MGPDDLHDHRLTRRAVLALGALAGAGSLINAGWEPLRALAAPSTSSLEVGRDAFGAGGRTGTLRAPGPFVLLGVRDPHGLGARLEVRARRAGGAWSPWLALHAHDGHAPDGAPRARAGDPVWTGPADQLELRATARPRRAVRLALVSVPPAARALAGARAAAAAHAAQSTGEPAIVPRAAWGGNGVAPRAAPSYGTVEIGVVHHTDNANTYSASESAGIVLAIAQYHRNVNGWNDIGYNFLVDRFGTIFEGRAGGIELPVIGAHAQGFNHLSTGVAVIGTFMDVEAPPAAVSAVARLLAWKLPLHGSPVTGQIQVVSDGGALTQWRAGTTVTLDRICGHRDVDATDCPGTRFYAQLPALRALTASEAQPVLLSPTVSLGGPPAVPYGGTARLTGVLTDGQKAPLAGQPVRLDKQGPGGGWTTIARGTTGTDGAFALSVPWTRPGLVRATALQVASLPVQVGIIPLVTAAAGASQVAAGSAVTVSGSARPAGTVTVVVEARRAGRWRRIAAVGARARPAFAVGVRLPRPGSYRLTVRSSRDGRVGVATPLLVRAR